MRYCDIAARAWHARAVQQANPALDVSLAAASEAAADARAAVVNAFSGRVDTETLAHARGISRDDDTHVWVELVCWPATNRTGR